MVHGHALGPAGAAAGEEHVEQVVRRGGAGAFEKRTVLQVDVLDEQHLGRGALEEVLMCAAGDHHGRLGILQHAGDALGGVGGIDG